MKKVGHAIGAVRKKKGLSQGDLAESAGVSQTYLSLVECGHAMPTLPLLERISAALGVPTYYLAFMGLDVETEIAEDRRDAYRKMRPAISGLIEGFFIDSE